MKCNLVIPQKVKHIYHPVSPLFVIYSQIVNNNLNRYQCLQKHYSQELKRQKQPKYSSADKWVDKKWYIHTLEYYSAVKNLIHAITQMNLENIVPCEISQAQRTNNIGYDLYEVLRIGKFILTVD